VQNPSVISPQNFQLGSSTGPSLMVTVENQLSLVRMIAKTRKTESNCWEYSFSVVKRTGYPAMHRMINGKRKEYKLSRWVMHLVTGMPLEASDWVLHKCDNRLCINPDHLYLGDRKQNFKDMRERKRNPRGETHHSAKYSDATVAEVRKLRTQGLLQREISERLGIPTSTVDGFLNGRKRWGI
jgi:predicted XRE-type DNA-binding protein